MKKRGKVVAGGVAGSLLSGLGGGAVMLGAAATTSVLWPLVGGFAIGSGVTYVGIKVVEACNRAQALAFLNQMAADEAEKARKDGTDATHTPAA